MSRRRRARAKAERAFSFVLLSVGRGVGAWKPVTKAVASVTGVTILAVVGFALKADLLLVVVAVVVVLVLLFFVGAFSLWDELDSGDGPSGVRVSGSALVESHVQRQPSGPGPDVLSFEMRTVERVLDLQSARGAARAVRFREPFRRIIRPEDIPTEIGWGPPWRRRHLLVKGFSSTTLLLERIGPTPGPFVVEVYFDAA